MLSYFAALVITLLVELPTLNIEKSLLFPTKPTLKSEKKDDQLLTSDIEQETKVNDSYNQNGFEYQKNGIKAKTNGFTTDYSNGHSNGESNGHSNGHSNGLAVTQN